MCSGPVEQFRPMTWIGSASSVTRTAPTSVPSSMRPVVSRLTWAWIGTHSPVRLNMRAIPAIAALVSRTSCWVSISSRSAPASTSDCACSP
jgi:hypothetical protein